MEWPADTAGETMDLFAQRMAGLDFKLRMPEIRQLYRLHPPKPAHGGGSACRSRGTQAIIHYAPLRNFMHFLPPPPSFTCRFAACIAVLAGLVPANGQAEQPVLLLHKQANGYDLTVQGVGANTYFYQHSLDMTTWHFLPYMDVGVASGNLTMHCEISGATKSYFRLKYTNAPGNDFDNDGIQNRAEVETHGTDPFESDSDHDGLTDHWEITHYFPPNSPASPDGNGDADGDGLNNLQESALGTDPRNIDSDADGAGDGYESDFNTNALSPDQYPPMMRYVTRYGDAKNDGGDHYIRYSGYGIAGSIQKDWPAPRNLSGLGALLINPPSSGPAVPALSLTPPFDAARRQTMESRFFGAYAFYGSGYSSAHSYSTKMDRCWLEQKPAPVGTAVSRTFVHRVHTTVDGSAQTTFTPVTFTIPANTAQSHSEYHDLAPALVDMNPAILMLAMSQSLEADLIPVDLGVDNNRDGTLALGSGVDQTTAQKPYRFWLNNDDDTGYNADSDTYVANRDNPWTPQVVDSLDEKIEWARDLEDFARLHLKVESLHSQLAAGTMTLGLKWKTVQSGAPKIRLFKAVEADGGTKYLSDTAKAADQVSASTSAIGVVQGTTVLDLPVSFWTSTTSSPTKFFLFEAIGEGKGELTMVFKQSATVIGEGGSVFLDLLDIRKMYEQWGISRSAVIQDPDRDVLLPISGVTAVRYHTPETGTPLHDFQLAWDENLQDKNYVICVHGWRKGGPAAATAAQFYKGRSDEITIFKRLWHRGFKGRYIGFIWPTYDVEVGGQSTDWEAFQSALQSRFDHNEYRAWKCGEAFKNMVNGLPAGYKKKIIAHSLGNVVVGSALEKGMVVDNYALLNAAISARCYHQGAATPINNSKDDLSDDPTIAVRVLSYRGDAATIGHARLENVGGKLSNFYLPNDYAPSGQLGCWEDGQYLKPIKEYEYDSLFSNEVYWDSAGSLNRVVIDPHEGMAMVNTSHSKAVGSAPVTTGAGGTGIDTNVDMNAAGILFDREHEAVFKLRCARTWGFYSILWDQLNLPGTKAP